MRAQLGYKLFIKVKIINFKENKKLKNDVS
jgi:hypothetical protein